MTSANDFISLLADKLARPTPTRAPEAVPFNVPEYHLPNLEERASVFLQNWQALGGKGAIVSSADETIRYLKEWFGDLTSDQVDHPSIVTWDELPQLAESVFETLNWPLIRYPQADERYMTAAQAALGVTGADWGIALSGTVVIKSDSQRGRGVSLLPPRHLTFIEISKLRNNLWEVLEALSEAGSPPASIELITGPSRTSDIEMDLSIGVHGPIEVYVLVVED